MFCAETRLVQAMPQDSGPIYGGKSMQKDNKFYNKSSVGGDYYEDDEIIDIPTVFMKAGVFTGSDGVPRLKSWDVLKNSADAFVGRPITDGHIDGWPSPATPTIGYIKSAVAREKQQDIAGISRIFKQKLSAEKLQKLKNGIDGSAGYYTAVNDVSGYHENRMYKSQEVGGYEIAEYAFLWDQKGACPRSAGCGPQPKLKNAQDMINEAFAPVTKTLNRMLWQGWLRQQ